MEKAAGMHFKAHNAAYPRRLKEGAERMKWVPCNENRQTKTPSIPRPCTQLVAMPLLLLSRVSSVCTGRLSSPSCSRTLKVQRCHLSLGASLLCAGSSPNPVQCWLTRTDPRSSTVPGGVMPESVPCKDARWSDAGKRSC
ncbi:hypothetical protein NDU88_000977 [Pleurodeles waltl]|uniref:Uncharacterized protein n=1 Tax=Pleurodeles waltl TaxID=8319 RepID=A0AAV7N9H6_PLEWA|nr:hypothetical protein NDU88_000977 [Pleurodeles waltl]